jgi:putative endonuclease
MSEFYVYIMTNRSGTLYIGVTNDIYRRAHEHKTGATNGFSKRYKMDRLAYVESTPYVNDALAREKQLKGWTRKRKIELIRELNPYWRDLSEDWYVETNRPLSGQGETLRSAQNDKQTLPQSVGDHVLRVTLKEIESCTT